MADVPTVVQDAIALDRTLPLLAADLAPDQRRALRAMDRRLVRRLDQINRQAARSADGWQRRLADGVDPTVLRAKTHTEVEQFRELMHEGRTIAALLHRWETLRPGFGEAP